jgi:hypothetical protein
MAVLGG